MTEPSRLDDLTVRGLRGLRNIELEKLGRLNLIVGKNDVGKTSVLEAVFLLAGLGGSRLPVAVQSLRGHKVVDSQDMSLLFHGLDVGNRIEIAASTPRDTRVMTISASHPDVIIERGQRLSREACGPPLVFRCTTTLTPHDTGKPRVYSGTAVATGGENKTVDDPDVGTRMGVIPTGVVASFYSYSPKVVSDVFVEKRTDVLIDCMRTVNPRVEGLVLNGDVAYVDLGLDRMIPLDMCGSGLVRTVQAFSACILGQVQVLLIDEIGSGLHYTAIGPVLEALLKMSEQHNVQILATTHNREALENIQQTLDREDCRRFQSDTETYALERNKDGEVCAYRYDYDQFQHAVSRGIEVR